LNRLGVGVQDLHAILLTHIHLDHAGAVGSLVKENPELAVFVHEFGAMHMADPAKLLASAGRLYGTEMDRLYGTVLPVPEENLRALEGGETVTIGKRDFEILYTPGHASHHLTFWDAQDGTAFIGDIGGISVEGDEFILPATPPPDIDIEIWNQSLDAIAALRPAKLFLTHFGYANDPNAHIARYRERLTSWSALVTNLLSSGKTEDVAAQEFVAAVAGETKHAVSATEADHYIFNGGLYLSWLGLLRYTKKKAQRTSGA
jgi:glyoxylase-like metal-dependent hydrolase (beta-lactamase superfamily II)